jgi:hypothetical protein
MVAGIVFQLASMTLFVALLVDFVRRARGAGVVLGASGKSLVGVLFSVALIYVRSVYRTVELAQGWTGFLITHEGYFVGLDAACMVAAVGVYNVPWLFPIRFGGEMKHRELVDERDRVELEEVKRGDGEVNETGSENAS